MILIVHNEKRKARAVSDMLYHMGILSDVTAPHDIINSASDACRAIVFMDPNWIPDVESLITRIRMYNSKIPIFALKSAISSDYSDDLFDSIIRADAGSSQMIYDIVRYQHERGLPVSTCYNLAGINASCNMYQVTFFGTNIKLTKTETMILRYLIVSYPAPQDTKDILRYAFKHLGKPEATSIRTHVSLINKKFKALKQRPLIINLQGEGYVICTPEILESIKNGERRYTGRCITV